MRFFYILLSITSQFVIAQSADSLNQNILDSIRLDNEFSQPWKSVEPAIIIDAYGLNLIDWDKMKADSNVVAVIHKCSEALRLDSRYKERELSAKSNGYLWGSYHLGRSGDPIEQAKFYLSQISDLETDLISLDLEDVNNPKFMDLANAEKFINYVHKVTGRYPLLYCNNNVLNQITKEYGSESSFAKCPLWYARFKNTVTDFNSNCWSNYTLWQFSCEINCEKTGECPYNVPGTAFDMDVNVFNGSKKELEKVWPLYLK
ncbi:MAG: lysozyme [Arenicella sp.]|jgi:lysozyme